MKTINATRAGIFATLAAEKPKILGFIQKKTENQNESEDIYQEAMARVAKQLFEDEKLDNPVNYLYRVTINIINDHYRRRQIVDMSAQLPEDITCENPTPEQQLEDQQRMALFIECLNELPLIARNIIVMRKLHGKSNVEIADQLGMSPKAVEKQLNRSIKAIEKKMNQCTQLPPAKTGHD